MIGFLSELDEVARGVLDITDFSYRLSPEEWLRQCGGMTIGEIIQKELDIYHEKIIFAQ